MVIECPPPHRRSARRQEGLPWRAWPRCRPQSTPSLESSRRRAAMPMSHGHSTATRLEHPSLTQTTADRMGTPRKKRDRPPRFIQHTHQACRSLFPLGFDNTLPSLFMRSPIAALFCQMLFDRETPKHPHKPTETHTRVDPPGAVSLIGEHPPSDKEHRSVLALHCRLVRASHSDDRCSIGYVSSCCSLTPAGVTGVTWRTLTVLNTSSAIVPTV